MKLKIYTDGACSGNPGKGGWAAIILDSNLNQSSISGGESSTTNNRMELMAPIMALKKIKTTLWLQKLCQQILKQFSCSFRLFSSENQCIQIRDI